MPQLINECENENGETDFIERHQSIQLEPFLHQVGGHASIFSYDEESVCKPFIRNEVEFYETLPKALERFTPKFRGVIEVECKESIDGSNILFVTHPPRNLFPRHSKYPKSGKFSFNVDQLQTLKQHNPWLLQCHKMQISKFQLSLSRSHFQQFLLLENVTRRFECPCVLDLKMGTRQYGDDAPPNKVQSKSAKAAKSTSSSLGVRICGMQVYQETSEKYICRDKYFGQKLTVLGFKEGLQQFLHNGHRLRSELIPDLLDKLWDLHTTLEKLESYRFYTSSLLLVYDGAMKTSIDADEFPAVDVRMIDFAHSTHQRLKSCNVYHCGPDEGYLFGIKNIIQVLKEIAHIQ